MAETLRKVKSYENKSLGSIQGGAINEKDIQIQSNSISQKLQRGELYEREIKNILKFYGEEAWIATAGLLSSNTMSVNVMVLTSDSILKQIHSDIEYTTGFEIKEGY